MMKKARRTYSSVGHEHGVGKGARQVRNAVLLESSLVEHTSGKHLCHGVRLASSGAEARRHEGLRFGVPDVAVVDANHGDEADAEADGLVDLHLEGVGSSAGGDLVMSVLVLLYIVYILFRSKGRRRTHVLPIERDAKQAQTLVVQRATKQVGKHSSLVASRVHRSQTGDRDRVEPRPDVGREELVEEHA